MSYQNIVVDFLGIFTKSSHKILKLEHLNIQKLIKNWKISCYVFVEISKKSKQYFDILYIAIHHSYLPKVSLCISGGEAGKQISAPLKKVQIPNIIDVVQWGKGRLSWGLRWSCRLLGRGQVCAGCPNVLLVLQK